MYTLNCVFEKWEQIRGAEMSDLLHHGVRVHSETPNTETNAGGSRGYSLGVMVDLLMAITGEKLNGVWEKNVRIVLTFKS